MTTGTYRYQNDDRSTYFRGYVEWYEMRGEKMTQVRVNAPLVRKVRGEAERDARVLAKMGNARGKMWLLKDKELTIETI